MVFAYEDIWMDTCPVDLVSSNFIWTPGMLKTTCRLAVCFLSLRGFKQIPLYNNVFQQMSKGSYWFPSLHQ